MLHNSQKDFIGRHIGVSDNDQKKMLKDLNFKSLDQHINSTVPKKIQFKDELNFFKIFYNYFLNSACAAANLATGTRNGEQDT